MGNYIAGTAKLLNANTQKFAWQAENVQTGNSSIAFQLERQKSASYPFGVSYELVFSADPGLFQLDIQHSDTDKDANFVTVNSVSNVNASWVARIELPATYCKYVRGNMVLLTNAVTTTLQVTR